MKREIIKIKTDFIKLDSFLKAPLKATIVDYFINFLPYFANQFSPLFTFIAVIFFTSKLAGNSEIIAMLSSGMSYRRLLRPYLVSALIIACCTYVLSAYIIPPANVKRINYTNTYVKNKRVDYGANIMLMVSPGQIAYMSRYDNITKTGIKFSLESFDENKRLVSRLTSQSIKWDTLYNWRVSDYVIRDFVGDREFIKKGIRLDTIIPFEPRDFLISKNDEEELTMPQLVEYIDRQRQRGMANIQTFEIEYHRRPERGKNDGKDELQHRLVRQRRLHRNDYLKRRQRKRQQKAAVHQLEAQSQPQGSRHQ